MKNKTLSGLTTERRKLKLAEIGLERLGLLDDYLRSKFNEWKDYNNYRIEHLKKKERNTPNAPLYLLTPSSNCD